MSGKFGRKPLIGEQINWSHPLAADLKLCLIFNEGAGNLVNDYSNNKFDGIPGSAGNNSIWTTTERGSAIETQNTEATAISLRSIDNTDLLVDFTQPISIEVLFSVLTMGTTETILSLADVNDTDGWIWTYGSDTDRRFTWGQNFTANSLSGHDLSDFSVLPTDVWMHFVLTMADILDRNVGNGHRLYRDSREIVVVSRSPGWSDGPFNEIGIQDDGFGTFARFSTVRIWQRELTLLDVRSLYVSPYSMFKQSPFGRIFVPSVVGQSLVFQDPLLTGRHPHLRM